MGAGYQCGALSAALRGTPYRLLAATRHRVETIHLFSSQALLTELAEVLARPHLSKTLAAIEQSPSQVLADYAAVVEIVVPAYVPQVVRNNPDDDQVIACALAARASVIVSGDGDLLDLESYEGIAILTARQAFGQIEGEV